MTPEMQQQIEEQQPLFGALITEPDGVSFTRDELAGVPVEITEPVAVRVCACVFVCARELAHSHLSVYLSVAICVHMSAIPRRLQ